jgi:hypothetical protein
MKKLSKKQKRALSELFKWCKEHNASITLPYGVFYVHGLPIGQASPSGVWVMKEDRELRTIERIVKK